jgi:hypothetical protein
MKPFPIGLTASLMFLLLVTACNDDDSDPSPANTLTGTWQLEKYERQDSTGTYQDVTDVLFDPCDLDNTITFNSDGSYKVDEGASKCEEDDPQIIEQGTWTLIQDNSKLVTTADTSSVQDTLNITSLTNSKLVWQEETDTTGVRVTYAQQ